MTASLAVQRLSEYVQAVLDSIRLEIAAAIRNADTRAAADRTVTGDGIALSERDVRIVHHPRRAEQLRGAQQRIMFGRIDTDDTHTYIGQQSVLDHISHDVLLWTGVLRPRDRTRLQRRPHPLGARTRTHIKPGAWAVTTIETEHLTARADVDEADAAPATKPAKSVTSQCGGGPCGHRSTGQRNRGRRQGRRPFSATIANDDVCAGVTVPLEVANGEGSYRPL